MWKKIGIGLITAVIALIIFVYMQLSTAQKEIAQLLNRHDILSEELDIGILPPALKLQRLKFTRPDLFVQADSAELMFNPWVLAGGKLQIEDIRLNGGVIIRGQDGTAPPDYHGINLSLKPTALYTSDLPDLLRFAESNRLSSELAYRFAPKISLQIQNQYKDSMEFVIDSLITPDEVSFSPAKITINLAQAAYQNQQQFDLTIGKGVFSKIFKHYEISADDWRINGESLGSVKGEILPPNEQRKSYLITLVSDACNDCTAHIELEKTAPKQRKLTFATTHFPLEKLLKAFQIPVFAAGKGRISAELAFIGLTPEKGKFLLNMHNGEIMGFNLLQLVGRYLPINYRTDNQMKTSYEHFTAQFDWQKTQLAIDKIYLRSKELLIEGEGKIELENMQCEIKLAIGVNESKYKELKLPMRFFDNCYSPQYKIEVNKGLRDQLKNLLKEKFN